MPKSSSAEADFKLSVVVVVNNYKKFSTHTEETLLERNQDLIDDRIIIDNVGNRRFASLARALNYGLEHARNSLVICCHQDVMFAPSFLRILKRQLPVLQQKWGVLGLAGIDFDGRWYLGSDLRTYFPVRVQTLDELCLIVARQSGLRFDDSVFDGVHCYGPDICLQAHRLGLGAYVIQSGDFSHPGGQASKDTSLVHYQKRLFKKWGRTFPIIWTTNGVIFGLRSQYLYTMKYHQLTLPVTLRSRYLYSSYYNPYNILYRFLRRHPLKNPRWR